MIYLFIATLFITAVLAGLLRSWAWDNYQLTKEPLWMMIVMPALGIQLIAVFSLAIILTNYFLSVD